jgi:hypothetical protein
MMMSMRLRLKAAMLALLAGTTFAFGIGACLNTAMERGFVAFVL